MHREEYLNLLAINPKIPDLLSQVSLPKLAAKLEHGRNQVKSTQVHSISRGEISNWGFGVPVDKHLRGFGDNVCGHLLCPSNRDWTDPVYVRSSPILPKFHRSDQISHSVRQQIQSFQIPVTHDDFPCFLWENERVDPQDINSGFLRGGLLVKVTLSLKLTLDVC